MTMTFQDAAIELASAHEGSAVELLKQNTRKEWKEWKEFYDSLDSEQQMDLLTAAYNVWRIRKVIDGMEMSCPDELD